MHFYCAKCDTKSIYISQTQKQWDIQLCTFYFVLFKKHVFTNWRCKKQYVVIFLEIIKILQKSLLFLYDFCPMKHKFTTIFWKISKIIDFVVVTV